MKSWFRIFTVFLCVFALHLTANAGAIEKLRNKSRGIASVKRVKTFKPKGFYVPHKKLKALDKKERVGYYRIFSGFIKDTDYLMRKNKKYSEVLKLRTPYEEMFFPRSNAVICSTSGFLVDNGKTTCDSTNWWFNASTSPEWDAVKPQHLSYEHCGNNHHCPASGIEVHNGQARGICGDSRGRSTACTRKFDGGGSARLETAFDECDKTNNGSSGFSNITCGQLRSDFQRTLEMYRRSCSSATGVVRTTCGNLRKSVESVAAKINQVASPASPTSRNQYLPNQASCNALGDGIDSKAHGTTSSKHWDTLTEIASQNCSNLSRMDKNAARDLFGSCTESFGGDESKLRDLMIDFGRRKADPEYGKAFVANFGMTPGIFERYFCGSSSHVAFSEKIKRFGESIGSTRSWLINNTPYHERVNNSETADITEPQFNSFKNFLTNNESSMMSLANQIKGNDSVAETLKSAREYGERFENDLKTKINELYTELRARRENQFENPSQDLAGWFERNLISKQTSNVRKLAMRAAISKVLQDQLLSPGHAARTAAAAETMNKCAEAVTEKGESVTSPSGTWTPNVSNHRGCRYVKETDLRGYNNAGNSPYVIFDREGGSNGERGACLKQDPDRPLPDIRSSAADGSVSLIKQISVFNPLRPDSVRQTIKIDAGSFDRNATGTEPLKRYVLYRYVCESGTIATTLDDGSLGAPTTY